MDFIEILEQLEKTSGTNDKIALIAANKDNVKLKEYLRLALDKNITFGIATINEVVPTNPLQCDYQTFFDGNPAHITDISWYIFSNMANAMAKRELTGNSAQDCIQMCKSWWTDLERKWYIKAILKDLSSIGIGQRLFEDAYDEDGFKFRLMLAGEQSELEKVEDGPSFLDKKANGVRTIATLEDDKVTAIFGGRNGLLAKNFYFIQEELELLASKFGSNVRSCVFDGEVHVDDCLEDTMSLYGFKYRAEEEFIGKNGKIKVKAYESYLNDQKRIDDFKSRAKFVIFDWMLLEHWEARDCPNTQADRKLSLEKINDVIKSLSLKRIEVIETQFCRNDTEAIAAAQEWIAKGFEGGIRKAADGLYEWKRSRNWIKIKESCDFEIKITGFEKQKTKYNSNGTPKPDMVGKVWGADRDNNKYKIGTGEALSEKVRQDMHEHPEKYLDKIATCSAQRPSEKGKYICARMDIIRLDRNSLD